MLYPQTFYYRISDPSCKRSIKVDIQKYKTVSDLKVQIALDLHLSESDIQLNNPYGEVNLADFPIKSEFSVDIIHRCYDIDFIFPDYSSIKIPKCYRMTFEEVLQYFDQNQIHFSSTTKNFIQFTVSNQEIPNIEYPFISIPKLTPVYINFAIPPVFITYDDIKFIFTENDSVSEVLNEIKSFYPFCSSVTLCRDFLNQTVFWEKLKSDKNYQIDVYFDVSFCSIDNSLSFTKKIEFCSTVDDVKSKIASEMSKSGQFINPKEVNLFDSEQNKIRGTNRTLKSYQSLFDTFLFEIGNETVNDHSNLRSGDDLSNEALNDHSNSRNKDDFSKEALNNQTNLRSRNNFSNDHSNLRSRADLANETLNNHSYLRNRNGISNDHSYLRNRNDFSNDYSNSESFEKKERKIDEYSRSRDDLSYSSYKSYSYCSYYESDSSSRSNQKVKNCHRDHDRPNRQRKRDHSDYEYDYDSSSISKKKKKERRRDSVRKEKETKRIEIEDISSDLTSDLSETESSDFYSTSYEN